MGSILGDDAEIAGQDDERTLDPIFDREPVTVFIDLGPHTRSLNELADGH